MRELVVYPDAEQATIQFLMPYLAQHSIPIDVRRGPGPVFVRVRRVGGTEETVAHDHPVLDVYVWADTDAKRMKLAQVLWGLLRAAAGDVTSSAVLYYVDTVLGPRQMPDPADDTKTVAMFTVSMLTRPLTETPPVVPIPAEEAIAGSPGYFMPEDCVTPLNLGEMDAVTAVPSGRWGNTQYVVCGDGSHVEWTGSAWRIDG